ncbi:MAG: DUF1592 domain-containing protein [Verrucomicrobiales bacterium]
MKKSLLITTILSLAASFGMADDFEREVWNKVAAKSCLKCHKAGGDAEESRFVLIDPKVGPKDAWLAKNRETFDKIAKLKKKGRPLVLQKVTEEIEHEGGDVLEKGSTGYKILEAFVNGSMSSKSQAPKVPFFEGITMLDDRRLLRRLSLSLAARLPRQPEYDLVEKDGLAAIPGIMDGLMNEDAFYERLLESFNDIFLMKGYDGSPERVLGYRNFGETRQWFSKVKFDHIEDEKERNKANYNLTDRYRESILHEPYALIEHIVRNDHPFTEIVTADYLMVSPMTAKAYDIYDEVKDKFKDPENHMEFVPAKLPMLTYRDGKPDQKTPTGLYPHSGLLSTFHYLQRYPTTDTNRNRLRARMYYQHFLGVDVLEMAPRVADAAAVDAAYEIPTMQASECVVCHKSVDPVAGLFKDYQEPDNNFGPYGPRKEGWFTDMFSPGFESNSIPEEDAWKGPQYLGAITAKDPRFAVAMVEHVYYIMMGRKVTLPPKDIDDPFFDARQRGYDEQRNEIASIAQKFRKSDFNLKIVFKALAQSRFYRAEGLGNSELSPGRAAEVADLGVMRLLTPEQLGRKVKAVFGYDWDLLSNTDFLRILYGGIDSKEVTERLVDPSGAMGAIQKMMANKVACAVVPLDFSIDPGKRMLFPTIEADALPEDEQKIRNAIVHLHARILDRQDAADDEEVSRTYQLFKDIVMDAKAQGQLDPRESYFCQANESGRIPDLNYTLRAWRAVVTYLLRQPEFLYE